MVGPSSSSRARGPHSNSGASGVRQFAGACCPQTRGSHSARRNLQLGDIEASQKEKVRLGRDVHSSHWNKSVNNAVIAGQLGEAADRRWLGLATLGSSIRLCTFRLNKLLETLA
ncbi:UNVERIFIED_CONTAM: hypothetical protein FKN15_038250 [Acipenser sinensis]